MCTAQCREVLCVNSSLLRGHCACTAQCREVLCVYYTVLRGTVCVLHSVERDCLSAALCRGALCV